MKPRSKHGTNSRAPESPTGDRIARRAKQKAQSIACLNNLKQSQLAYSLIEFVRDGLLDKRAQPEHFRSLVPERVPSGPAPLVFEFKKKLP